MKWLRKLFSNTIFLIAACIALLFGVLTALYLLGILDWILNEIMKNPFVVL